jgi:hypothetical protein
MLSPIGVVALGPERSKFLIPSSQKGSARLGEYDGVAQAVFAIVEFETHYSGVCQEIVEAAMHENVTIKIDAPALQKLLKADHIGPMRRVQQRSAEHCTRRFNFDDLNNIFRQIPPGALRLEFIVEECLIRLDALYSASNTCIVD